MTCYLSLSYSFSLRVAGRACLFQPQSKELSRGPLKLFQHFRLYRGSSHWRKSAACPKFDMVWLNLPPIPVGRRGVNDFYLSWLHIEEGVESAPCGSSRGGGGGRQQIKFGPLRVYLFYGAKAERRRNNDDICRGPEAGG